jgi:hypothetical protein
MVCLNLDWTPSEPLPAEYRDLLPSVLALAEQALRPVPVEAFAVMMDSFIEWLDLCGIGNLPDEEEARQDKIARIVRMYHAELGHLPADILDCVLSRTRQRHKWPKLPTPADMLELAAGELERRRFAKRRAEAAIRTGTFEEPQFKPRPTEEQKAAVAEVLAAAKLKTVPTGLDDGRPVRADVRGAYAVLKGVPFVHREPKGLADG